MHAPTEDRRVLMLADLVGYQRLTRGRPDLEIWALLDDFARLAHSHVAAAGGRVIKYLGDACFADFPPARALDAVDAAAAIRRDAGPLGQRHLGRPLRVSVNLHMGRVVTGAFGPHGWPDVIGAAVNHVMTMGGAEGLRLSEPVYRALPSDRRGPWSKHRPPAVYSLEG